MDEVRDILDGAVVHGEDLELYLHYPRDRQVKKFVIGLMDVRAADSIRVSYDFLRDGWKIEQASKFEWRGDDLVCDPDWQEVAFVKAWARARS
jgi:hypothetical protein